MAFTDRTHAVRNPSLGSRSFASFQDAAYEDQWAPWGNLRAAEGDKALEYRLVRRGEAPAGQQPRGTTLSHAYHRTQREGCTSLFNIGTSSNTFRHQGSSGTGDLVEDGPQLATRYNFPIPTRASISRPRSP